MGKPIAAAQELRTIATPTANPPAGALLLYAKSDGSIYTKNSAGVEAAVAGAGGGGGSAPELAATSDYTDGTPSAPTNGVKIFARHRARRIPAFIGPSGQDSALQPGMFTNRIGLAQSNANSATVSTFGVVTANVTAPTAVPINTGAFYTSLTRARWSTTATAGTGNGLRVNSLANFMSSTANMGGFFMVARWGLAVDSGTTRLFVGMAGTSAALSAAVNPSALTNTIGFGADAGDANLSVIHNDGSGTATKIGLGSSFPVAPVATNFYETRIFAASGGGQSVNWSITRLNDGTFSQFTTPLTTKIPALNTTLTPHTHVANGTTAAVASIDVQSIYIESDN